MIYMKFKRYEITNLHRINKTTTVVDNKRQFFVPSGGKIPRVAQVQMRS
jgi:hypothetical protein